MAKPSIPETSIQEIDPNETNTEDSQDIDQSEQYKDFCTKIKEIKDEKILQVFIIVAIEIFGIQVAQVENIQNFSEIYKLIETAVVTKDVAPSIVHEIIEFVESIDPDVTRALKEKAKAAITEVITDEVDIKSEFPNLEFVMTLGATVSSMEENDYDKFCEYIAKKILKDPPEKMMERYMIIHKLIQRKHLKLKPNHSSYKRETTPTIDETVVTTEGVDPDFKLKRENTEKFIKWLDQSSCTNINWGFIDKYCKRNDIKLDLPKKGMNFICI